MLFLFIICYVLTQSTVTVSSIKLQNVTRDVFPDGQYLGVIAAFGDFNSDKLTDLFCIKQGDKTLEILFSNDTEASFGRTKLNCTFKNIITGVVPGDYDGDAKMDVLITLQRENSKIIDVVVLWGSLDRIDCNTDIVMNMSSQPFVLDYNDDMILDVMGEDEDFNRCVWLSSVKKNFTKKLIFKTKEIQRLKTPHSCAVVDLNNDLVADLLITGNEKIELWVKKGQNFVLSQNISYPHKANIIGKVGQSTFVDFNTNSEIDHIIPVCFDSKCRNSSILVWNRKSLEWITLLNNFTYNGELWGFALNQRTVLETAALPITLRSGDFNLDGYPDFITVIENKKKPDRKKVVILENAPCSNCSLQRTLNIHWNINGLDDVGNVQLAAFFDMRENGIMDVIVSTESGSEWKTHVLENVDTYDAYFIKVLVLSGICEQNRCDRIPYGTNQVGPMIMFNTSKPDGDPLSSCAVQMPQSAYFPLNLPYTVFGLGQTPNFVDHLTVSIPVMKNNQSHKREWTQIIPNSQMVVVPYPPEDEHRWVMKLFVTPSNLVVKTCFALIGTCAFIGFLISILHWRERREDKREKMQDAYRFHFDAM